MQSIILFALLATAPHELQEKIRALSEEYYQFDSSLDDIHSEKWQAVHANLKSKMPEVIGFSLLMTVGIPGSIIAHTLVDHGVSVVLGGNLLMLSWLSLLSAGWIANNLRNRPWPIARTDYLTKERAEIYEAAKILYDDSDFSKSAHVHSFLDGGMSPAELEREIDFRFLGNERSRTSKEETPSKRELIGKVAAIMAKVQLVDLRANILMSSTQDREIDFRTLVKSVSSGCQFILRTIQRK